MSLERTDWWVTHESIRQDKRSSNCERWSASPDEKNSIPMTSALHFLPKASKLEQDKLATYDKEKLCPCPMTSETKNSTCVESRGYRTLLASEDFKCIPFCLYKDGKGYGPKSQDLLQTWREKGYAFLLHHLGRISMGSSVRRVKAAVQAKSRGQSGPQRAYPDRFHFFSWRQHLEPCRTTFEPLSADPILSLISFCHERQRSCTVYQTLKAPNSWG